MMTLLMLLPILAPLAAAASTAALGWQRLTGWITVAAALVTLACGVALATAIGAHPHLRLDGLLRADGLSVTMLLVIGTVGTLSCWASIGYLDTELAHGHTTARRARLYGVLVAVFLAAMATAVLANNLGVLWVAIEATTVVTAFLVGHRGTRTALEATWKYVIICSVGIAFAFLGTVLLYFASVHTGAPDAHALDLDVLLAHAHHLDPGVTRMAAGLLLLGYGAKVGLAPFHTWLADAHSQAPAPVSALMSGVLLSVAFAALLRVKSVLDIAIGPGFLRTGLLSLGLLTLLIAASLLLAQRDIKRMLAYSSMENMGLIAIAAAAGTRLAITALLLHVLAHGIAKTVLFLCAGQLQSTHDSTAVADVTALLARSRLLGVAFTIGMLVLLGLPPFAMFASELSIARGLTQAHLAWALGVALVLIVIAFAALVTNTSRMLLGAPQPDAPVMTVPATVSTALLVGITACVALGITAGPLTGLFHTAATILGGSG
jgi:hydrogenase-4 component F